MLKVPIHLFVGIGEAEGQPAAGLHEGNRLRQRPGHRQAHEGAQRHLQVPQLQDRSLPGKGK